jgi:hypothetical protein
MPRVGFEPTIPVFERAKAVHSLDRAPTVIGHCSVWRAVNITLHGVTSKETEIFIVTAEKT